MLPATRPGVLPGQGRWRSQTVAPYTFFRRISLRSAQRNGRR